MIENYRQYLITKKRADRFEEASKKEYSDRPEWVGRCLIEQYSVQAEELRYEMYEYDRGLMYE